MVEPIAKFRSRRANAGANIAALIEEQRDKLVTQGTGDDADIYASAYGGFQEDEDEKVSLYRPRNRRKRIFLGCRPSNAGRRQRLHIVRDARQR